MAYIPQYQNRFARPTKPQSVLDPPAQRGGGFGLTPSRTKNVMQAPTGFYSKPGGFGAPAGGTNYQGLLDVLRRYITPKFGTKFQIQTPMAYTGETGWRYGDDNAGSFGSMYKGPTGNFQDQNYAITGAGNYPGAYSDPGRTQAGIQQSQETLPNWNVSQKTSQPREPWWKRGLGGKGYNPNWGRF